MKQAIWKVAPFGDFKFRGQPTRPTYAWARTLLLTSACLRRSFGKSFRAKGWQKIEDVERLRESPMQRTFILSHLKVKTLKPMEASGQIEVKSGTRKRSGTYPNGTVLRFV